MGLFGNSEEKKRKKREEQAQKEFEWGVYYDRNDKPAAAMKSYRKAAELGHADAMGCYAECFELGKGVEKNIAEAIKWYERALEAGSIFAPDALGDVYRSGKGVDVDLEKAVYYYKIGSNRGDACAMVDYANALYYGKGIEANPQKAYNIAVQANNKKKNYGYCEALLGICFEEGKAVGKDLYKALDWYRKAKSHGSPYGTEKCAELESYVQELPKEKETKEQINEKILAALKRGRYSDAVEICLVRADEDQSYLQRALQLACQAKRATLSGFDEEYEPVVPDNEGIALFEKGREAERAGQDFVQAYRYYEKAAELKHPEAVYRLSELAGIVKENWKKWEEEAKRIRHPLAVSNWASIFKRIEAGDTDALWKIGGYYGNSEEIKCAKMCLAYIYARRAAKGDAEAVYEMEVSCRKYQVDGFDGWKKNLHLLENYGLWWLHKAAMITDYEDTALKKEKVAYAERALQYGVLCAQEQIDRVSLENRLQASERAAERRAKEKAVEEYKKKLDDRERWRNLATEGKFRTEQDAYFEGGRDAWDNAFNEYKRKKKLDDFKRNLEED